MNTHCPNKTIGYEMTINSNDSVTQKSELCFECPECGGNGIVEHLVNYEAIFIHEDGDYETGERSSGKKTTLSIPA